MPGRQSRTNANESIEIDSEVVIRCVRYILCRESSKIPIKRAEIIKHLSTMGPVLSNEINVIIKESDKMLKEIYGYKLVQVESKSGIQYIVVLVNRCEDSPLSTVVDIYQHQLLSVALTHIFISRAPVKEDDMWSFLSETGFLEENDHAGRKLLTHLFPRQLYLKYYKVGEGEVAKNVFEWGQRAIEEVPKMFLLKKFADEFQKDPSYWSEQFKDCSLEDAI